MAVNPSFSNKSVSDYSTNWELSAPKSKIDLLIKKIAISIIALANFAMIGAVLYYIIMYCPIPTQALLVSPFIAGTLAALAYLKFPTLGVRSENYSSYLNPTYLVGKIVTYILFGPLTYAIETTDLTAYHDPIEANKISRDLEELSFDQIADQYVFDNLIKYGFIQESKKGDVLDLRQKYAAQKKALAFWKQADKEGREVLDIQNQVKAIDDEWQDLKNTFEPFPHPKNPSYDFSSPLTPIRIKARHYF